MKCNFKIIRHAIFLLMILVGSVNSIQAQLNGINSINPSGTNFIGNPGGWTGKNYTSINSAINALRLYGISNTVTFNISSGTYTEQVAIPEITSASATKRIIFQSAANDSSSVIIQYAPRHVDSNYVVLLAGADYITIRKLSIQAIGGKYNNSILIKALGTNEANSNIISNNSIQSQGKTGICVYLTGISSSYPSIGTIIDTNFISQGLISIYTDEFTQNNQIRKNYITDFAEEGIYSHKNYGITVIGNTIHSNAGSGIDIDRGIGTTKVSANKVSIQNFIKGVTGIGVSYATSPVTIDNNFVSISGSGSNSDCGIYVFSNTNATVVYNSIVSYKPASIGLYVYYSSSNTLTSMNNNVANFGGGYAIVTSSVNTSDYNNYYTTGLNIGRYISTDISDLTTWKSTTGTDNHSISVYPGFYSVTDLHCGSAQINNAGTWVSSFTKDIDNENRNMYSDIGADEFTPVANDAYIVEMTSNNPACKGINDVVIRLKNIGTTNLTSVNLNWSVNGSIQTPLSLTGSGLIPMQQFEERNIVIGSYNFVSGNTYKMKFWSSDPNGFSDGNPKNDTFTLNKLTVGLSGTYTIGSTSSDYLTINDAINDLKLKGMGCPVTFRILPGVYNEQLLITSIPGSSNINLLTFESYNMDSTSVIIRNAASSTYDDYVVKLSGAEYITFLNLTFQSTGTQWANVIVIDSTSSYNEFINNVIITPRASSNATTSCFYSKGSNSQKFNVIENNLISGGAYGINLTSNGSNITIQQNIIKGFSSYGIWVSSQRAFNIANNIISSDSMVSSVYGIYVKSCFDSISITGNNILMNRASGCYGFYFDVCLGTTSNPILLANNMVVVIPYLSSSKCVCFSNSRYILILNNTFKICKGLIKSGPVLEASSACQNLTIVNNIISNFNGAYALNLYQTSVARSDYNDIFTFDTFYCIWNYNVVAKNLIEWKNLTKLDSHSVSVNPFFKSETDLHSDSKYIDSAGTPNSHIINDIDGELRNPLMPDIGADEFNLFNRDASIISLLSPLPACDGSSSNIVIKLRNNGVQKITSLSVKWTVNNQPPAIKNISCSINPSSDTQLYIGSYTFSSGNNYDIKFWVESVNSLADENHNNDTFTYKDLRTGLQGNYTIGKGKNYEDFNLAIADLINYGICSNVVFTVDTGIYNEHFSIPPIPNNDTAYSVTFKSSSNDSNLSRIQYSAGSVQDNYIIQLNGSDNIKFEKFTIKSLSSSIYGKVIDIRNQSKHNTFIHNCIIGINSTYEDDVCINTDLRGSNNYNLFENNFIQHGYGGILLNSYNYSGTNPDIGNVIKNNKIDNTSVFCIYCTMQNSFKIDGNIIGSSSSFGIYINSGSGNDTIINNNILMSVIENKTYIGIDLEVLSCTASTPAFIANNFINIIDYTYLTYTGPIIGLFSNHCSYNKMYHNTIRTALLSYNSSSAPVKFYTYSNSPYRNNEFKNNIVINENNVSWAIDVASYAVGVNYLKSSDYNVFFTSGPDFGVYGSKAATLSSWQALSKMDSHSVVLLPSFKSREDLHLCDYSNIRVSNPLKDVITDIDNEVRSNQKPSAGADDYPMNNIDAGIVKLLSPFREICEGSQSFEVRICNYGKNTIDSVDIGWKVNGVTRPTVKYRNPLGHLQEADIKLGYDNFNLTGSNEISVNILSVNGMSDQNNQNNTLILNNFTIYQKPVILSVSNDSVCINSDAHLSVKTNNSSCLWYKLGTTVPIANDTTLVINNITKTTAYYVEAVSNGIHDSLTTSNKLGSGDEQGSFSLLIAKQSDLIIDSFSIQLSCMAGKILPIVVMYKKGSYVGYERNSSAWSVLGYDTIISKGLLEYQTISAGQLKINQNDSISVFIWFLSAWGNQIGTLSTAGFSNNDLRISKGALIPGLFYGTLINNVIFNGKVYYRAGYACKSSADTVTAYVLPVPNVNFDNELYLCKGGYKTLDAGYGSGFDYTWKYGTKSDTISKSQKLITDSAGVYSITVKDNCGNSSSDIVRITVTDSPDADFIINNDTQCFNNNEFVLQNNSKIGIGNLKSTWDLGNGSTLNTTDVKYSYPSTGRYAIKLHVLSDYNCTDSVTKQILVKPSPVVYLGKDTTILADKKITLNAGNDFDTYLWSNGSKTKSTLIDSSGTGFGKKIVWVMVNKDGCEGGDTILITFKSGSGILNLSNPIIVKIYPNPTHDNLHISIETPLENRFLLRIISANGGIAYNSVLNSDLTTINIQNLKKGMYYLIISNEFCSKTIKFVKQ